jgi:hypothetical protein
MMVSIFFLSSSGMTIPDGQAETAKQIEGRANKPTHLYYFKR